MLLYVFFNDTATTEIYTLSLHDALPISEVGERCAAGGQRLLPAPQGRDQLAGAVDVLLVVELVVDGDDRRVVAGGQALGDRKSTRLNSSHANISYAVFCLKKKKQ